MWGRNNTHEESKQDVDGSDQWMCGVTKKDMISNAMIRGTIQVVEVSEKAQETRLRCYEHVMRSDGEGVER